MSLYLVLVAAFGGGTAGTAAVVGIISVVAFLFVYAIRKLFGKQWDWLAGKIPALNFSMTPGWTLLSKFAQAIPATLFAAGLGALTSGGSLVPTLLAALAGPLAALGHEFLKAFPLIPYTGSTNVGTKIPGAPKLPTGVACLMIAISLGGCAALLSDLKPIDQAAVLLCADFFSQSNPGLSLKDVEKEFCATADAIAPFLAQAKSAEQKAGAIRMGQSEESSAGAGN